MTIKVMVVPVGHPEADSLTMLVRDLVAKGFDAVLGDRVETPNRAFDPSRAQYRADTILNSLPKHSSLYVLGVTDIDLYADGLNFVLGLADRFERAALISLARLGIGADPSRARERALKEAVHEICHMLGLGHCANRSCVMHFSNSLADTDRKTAQLCAECQRQIDRTVPR